MASQYGFNRKILISGLAAESTYGTANVSAVQLFRVSGEPFNLSLELVPDTDLVGGKEEATTQAVQSHAMSGQLTFPRVTPHGIATIASYAMGSSTPTGATDTSGYTHLIVPRTADHVLESFTMEELLKSGVQYQWAGCLVDGFELTVERKGFWQMTADIIASGKRVDGTATGTEISETFIKAGDTKFFKGTTYDASPVLGATDLGGTTLDATAKIVSATWRYRNNINADDLHEFDSRTTVAGVEYYHAARGERSRRTQELSLVVEFEDETWLDFLLNQTVITVELDAETKVLSGATTEFFGFQVAFPQVQIISADVVGGTDKLTVSLECSIQQHSSQGSVALMVSNKQTAYPTI